MALNTLERVGSLWVGNKLSNLEILSTNSKFLVALSQLVIQSLIT